MFTVRIQMLYLIIFRIIWIKRRILKTRKQKVYIDETGQEYTLDIRDGGNRVTKIYIEESLLRGKVVDSIWEYRQAEQLAAASFGYHNAETRAHLLSAFSCFLKRGRLGRDFFVGSGTNGSGGRAAGAQMDRQRPWQVRHPHHPQAHDRRPAAAQGRGPRLPRLRNPQPGPLRAAALYRRQSQPAGGGAATAIGGKRGGLPGAHSAGLPRRGGGRIPDFRRQEGWPAGGRRTGEPAGDPPLRRGDHPRMPREAHHSGGHPGIRIREGLFPNVLDEARARASTSPPSTSRPRCSTSAPWERNQWFFTDVALSRSTHAPAQEQRGGGTDRLFGLLLPGFRPPTPKPPTRTRPARSWWKKARS